MSVVFLGDDARISLRIRDANGNLVDPTAINLTITNPDGLTTTKTKPDFTTSGTGLWNYVDPTPPVGHYTWWAETVGPESGTGGFFDVVKRYAYVDVDAVRQVLAGSENLTGTAAGLTDADLANAISEAQTEVDSRLAGRYSVPFADPPQLISTVTRDIAAYLATLTARRGEAIQAGEAVTLRYTRAESMLGQIVSGQIDLDVVGETEPLEDTVTVRNPYDGNLFGPADFQLGPVPPGFELGGRWPGGLSGGW